MEPGWECTSWKKSNNNHRDGHHARPHHAERRKTMRKYYVKTEKDGIIKRSNSFETLDKFIRKLVLMPDGKGVKMRYVNDSPVVVESETGELCYPYDSKRTPFISDRYRYL